MSGALRQALALLLVLPAAAYSASAEWRDLNRNGRLDPYEDAARPVAERVDDLLGRMTLAEKAQLMFVYATNVNEDGTPGFEPDTGPERLVAIDNLRQYGLTHFNLMRVPTDLRRLAGWQNAIQREAETSTRLGIPVTIASDPRHHFSQAIFAFGTGQFSRFPEPLGLAAIGDLDLIDRYAAVVREEYLAVGIRLALHPQVDLATEPRWPRISGGFGEDAALTAEIARHYVLGLQGEHLAPGSVATMTKHFPGGGPQRDGLDPHFEFHRGQAYPGGRFEYHLGPFAAAIDAGTAAIMPYYGVPTGQTRQDVGMAFNRDIITGLLRERFHFDGVICADWGVITDTPAGDVLWPARAWGVEALSPLERVQTALVAGIDQFGGERRPELVVELVESGAIPEARIDSSARRILRLKFQLGLFDDPYVDVPAVTERVGRDASRQLGHDSQKRAMTLLSNGDAERGKVLPLPRSGGPIYVQGLDPRALEGLAEVADRPEDARYAVLRLSTPWYPVETANPFARDFHHGDLDFKGDELAAILDLLDRVPTIVVIYLDRPAVIPEIASRAAALLADFGASDRAVAELLFGIGKPEGHLPFELPSSMEAVREQLPDVPADSRNPLYPKGYGLAYE